MAKIVLLVGLFAFVAVQLSKAAPKPDDTTVVPSSSPAETPTPAPVVSSDDTTVHPSATTLSSAELFEDLSDTSSSSPKLTIVVENESKKVWWDYVPRRSMLKTESGVTRTTPQVLVAVINIVPARTTVFPTPTIQVKTEAVEVAAGTTEAAEVTA